MCPLPTLSGIVLSDSKIMQVFPEAVRFLAKLDATLDLLPNIEVLIEGIPV